MSNNQEGILINSCILQIILKNIAIGESGITSNTLRNKLQRGKKPDFLLSYMKAAPFL